MSFLPHALQCPPCQKHFEDDREYFAHLKTPEHEVNKNLELPPEEESLLNKFS